MIYRHFQAQVFQFNILSSLLALQMTARLCSRVQTHGVYPITGICLQKSCEDSPLACPLCAKQFHEGHLIVTLDYLSKSYLQAKVPSEFTDLVLKMKEKEAKLQKRAEQICTEVTQASTRLMQKVCSGNPFIDLLSKPIRLAQIPELIQYISSSRSFSLQTVKSYLPLLRTYYFHGGISVATQNTDSQSLHLTFLSLLKKFQYQAKLVINQIQQNIQKYCKERADISNSVVKKEQEVEAAIREFNLTRQHLEKADKIEEEQASLTSDEQRHKELLKKYNLARNQKEEGVKVVLRENKQVEINVLIHYIDVSSIKSLTLCNSATTCVVSSSSIDHIAKMVNLQALRLYWAKGLKDIQACRMLKNLYELRELCLCEFESCTPTFVNALKINNPKIRKLCFSANINHFVRFYEENIEFLPDTVYHYQDEDSWISLTNGLRDLTTLQLHRPQNKSYWISYIKRNAMRLTQFTVSCIDQSEVTSKSKIHELSYTPLLKALQDTKNLLCLRFEQVHFDEKHLLRVIEKNIKLQTFMASQCACITNRTYHLLTNVCQHIQQLSVQMDDKFAIDSIAGMHTIKTLVLRGCWGIKEDRFIQVISKMVQIKCLALDYNSEWVTIKTLIAIAKLPNLKVLNISGNNLNSTDIQALNNIPYLNTLLCFNNRFSYVHLINCPFAKTLKKLSISKNIASFPEEDDYEKVKMSLLAQSFPSLTHLKLRGFKCIRPEFLEMMPRLICLTVVESGKTEVQASKKFCKGNWIYFNEDIQ